MIPFIVHASVQLKKEIFWLRKNKHKQKGIIGDHITHTAI